jgi:large subunit ribosomal protein L4
MPKVDILNVSGERVGEIELNENIFGAEVNVSVLHEVVKNYLANQRQGTQSAKTRAEVRGGGRKPFKQKGTGRARQGTISAPNHVGGGIAFAPKPRSYRYSLPKKMKRVGMVSALSSKVEANTIIVLDELTLEAPKTKDMINILRNLKTEKKALVVLGEKNDTVVKSVNNIPGVQATFVGEMNVYDILNHGSFVITKEAVEKIEEVYA